MIKKVYHTTSTVHTRPMYNIVCKDKYEEMRTTSFPYHIKLGDEKNDSMYKNV